MMRPSRRPFLWFVEGTALDRVTGVMISGGASGDPVDWYEDAGDKKYRMVPTQKQLENATPLTLIFKVEGGSPVRKILQVRAT